MDIDTFFKKWQGQIETHYAAHVRQPMLAEMYNDLKTISDSSQELLLTINPPNKSLNPTKKEST